MENRDSEDTTETIYALRILAFASRSIDAAVLYVAETSGKGEAESANYATAFQRGVIAAIGTLASQPMRYPVAPEAVHLNAPSVRVMPFRYGGLVWRVLYRVHEADENDAPRVEIVTIRHGAQKPMTHAEGRDIDAVNRANK